MTAAIESMNGARFVHDQLELAGWDVAIADALKVKGLAPLAAKTDRIDAWVLAELCRRDLVPAIWLPDHHRAGRARAGSADALGTHDALVMDEAFQADAARYFAVGAIAPTHLLVGDSGQLDPFSTMDDPDRWRALAEDPLQTAVGVLLRHRPETAVHALPISRRLDHRAVELVRAFYPGHPFDAAVLPDVRGLQLAPGAAAFTHE